MAFWCRQGVAGEPLTVQILDRVDGTARATVPIGGGDQIAYDAPTNRYYLAASRWTSSGLSSGPACTAVSPFTALLPVIDASTPALVATGFLGDNEHPVALESVAPPQFLANS